MTDAAIPTTWDPPGAGTFAAPQAEGPWLLTPPGGPPRPAAGPGEDSEDEIRAVLFDRDGTLVEDVPYNADPALVRPQPKADEALAELRARGVATGVVSNQSGIARGRFTRAELMEANRRVEELLGPFGVWAICPHGPAGGCRCRKPAPGLILAACERLGVPPERTAVVGDIGSDLEAARAAGARGVLVPTPVTRREEIVSAGEWAPDLLTAVRRLLAGAPASTAEGAA
ncbi:HAD family hydrolase [Streptomyces sp. DSM 44917]|uniref:D,D-heptose 1,7-bisphosphate phosphatase n=1 Tax=Streptomyces boetiae TaxID=3075541 RepID=A0ABU2LBC4_9ACTN|nr:HAD family hydrolase [Streptomyces sp. DSM 44917]MDT0308886.1 HAD family hydrolase [Streptomyces sp. DSM 44917]